MTRTLTMGSPRERAPAPLVGCIQARVTIKGVSGTHSPLVPSTGTSQGHLQTPGDKTVWEVGGGWWEECRLGSSERQGRGKWMISVLIDRDLGPF